MSDIQLQVWSDSHFLFHRNLFYVRYHCFLFFTDVSYKDAICIEMEVLACFFRPTKPDPVKPDAVRPDAV